ncbi:hypothetical protein AXF42_Ash010177 [Apostasia shenzhenica]|uniref:Uncharacterized protein n=1 Tax=Apostasia shenzhenica TaxID=1088818 RepID=A0A2I0A9S5_9ASPA|nr:hypothetical protein AXF42_Ash010177 [Apostasia shenzhenica]
MFLLRNNAVAPDPTTILEKELSKDAKAASTPATTLEFLIGEDPYLNEEFDKHSEVSGDSTTKFEVSNGNHLNVAEDEGWITIPKGKVPNNWFEASDILQLRLLDRSFVFPGEQLHILVCLSAAKQEEEILTPFEVAAIMSRSESSIQNGTHQNYVLGTQDEEDDGLNGQVFLTGEKIDPEQHLTATKSLLQKEGHKQQIKTLLERFMLSNFFARIAESDEPLWSKRFLVEPSSINSDIVEGKFHSNDETLRKECSSFFSAFIDQGSFVSSASGGVARDTAKCYSLSNGDIVVRLRVNVAVSNIKNPVLEVLQFEKYGAISSDSETHRDLHCSNNDDPCGELLNWLLPLDRALPPPRTLSPSLGQAPALATQRSTSSYASSQILSFGHFRSYSMSSLSQATMPPLATPYNPRTAFDLEEFDRFTPEKSKASDTANRELLSFRGVSLVPERFSVHCGLEGIHLPGRRWRRKLEVVQPLEIHCFSAACTSEDLLCVQIKNVSPAHLPDITIYVDAITIIYEEASKEGPPSCLPIASIETGNGHTLPNLPLRRGEEHSFILKLASKVTVNVKGHGSEHSKIRHNKAGASSATSTLEPSDMRKNTLSTDQYAVLVSCRCNCTESKLFFKQPTSWQPHVPRDLMISVVSEMSNHYEAQNPRAPQLPVQVLTLHASNLSSEDLTLTILAPLSSSSPSVVPLSSTPTTPTNTLGAFSEFFERATGDRTSTSMQRLSSMPNVIDSQRVNDASGKRCVSIAQRGSTATDFISSTDLGCTHLWLQSSVPLGCVPAHSSTTVKLELLPLTDGIIALDTLQVAVKEKGVIYVPELPLKIYATSSIASEII